VVATTTRSKNKSRLASFRRGQGGIEPRHEGLRGGVSPGARNLGRPFHGFSAERAAIQNGFLDQIGKSARAGGGLRAVAPQILQSTGPGGFFRACNTRCSLGLESFTVPETQDAYWAWSLPQTEGSGLVTQRVVSKIRKTAQLHRWGGGEA